MSALQDVLGRIFELWGNIPTATTPIGAFPEAFDAAAFDTGKDFVRSMEAEIALVKQLDDPIASIEFENTHPRIQQRLLNALNKVAELVQQLISAITKKPNQQSNPEQNLARFREITQRLETYKSSESMEVLDFVRHVENRRKIDGVASAFSQERLQEFEMAAAEATKAKKAALEVAIDLEKKSEKAATFVLAEENVVEWQNVVESHETAARNWLIAGVAAIALVVRMFVWMLGSGDKLGFCFGPEFRPLPDKAEIGQVVAFALTKILAVSFVVGLCIVITRCYQSHVHNVIVNRQRKLAFVGLLKLNEALKGLDEPTRLEIVKHATQTIFSQTNTGFLDKSKNEFAPYLAELVEAAKSAAPK